jgi:AAA+ ATPase superfamily predicted ATPase
MPDRKAERAEICRILASGHSIQMLAPRRVGKTWLMRRVAEDLQTKGWMTVFTDVEGMRSEDEFLRDLCRKIEQTGSTSQAVLNHLSQRLRQLISGGWEGNPIHAIGRIDAKGFSEALVASLDAQGGKALILVDEIALFVTVLLARDEKATVDFLYHLRRLRQSYPRVQWLLTGSIGLDVVARRSQLHGALVDLEIFSL